ncbi:MAG: hypothetical protein ABSG52_06295 [Terriglobales bacterium]
MIEDAMSLQYALFQVMRLLTDKAVDTRRAALMLYALQIAASNLKRLHEETQEIANSGDIAHEKSLMKELLEVLQIPETEAERMAEEMAVEEERQKGSAVTHTIKACASGHAESPGDNHENENCHPERGRTPESKDPCSTDRHLPFPHSSTRDQLVHRTRVGGCATSSLCALCLAPCALRLQPCACSTFVPFGAQMPVNASKNPCYTSGSSR